MIAFSIRPPPAFRTFHRTCAGGFLIQTTPAREKNCVSHNLEKHSKIIKTIIKSEKKLKIINFMLDFSVRI